MTTSDSGSLHWAPTSTAMTEFSSRIGEGCRIILSWSGTSWSVVVRDDDLDIEAEIAQSPDLAGAKEAAEKHMRG